LGRNYRGWQKQHKGPTVQGELEKALTVLLREKIRVNGASRTDTGVNARGMAADFKTGSRMRANRIMSGLNGLLPADIAVTAVADAADDWHSRKSALWREYEYLIWNRPYPDLFRDGWTCHIRKPLDVAAIKRAAAAVEGTHDFKAFCVASSAHKGCVRTVMALLVDEPEPGLVRLTIRADGFVHKMVRSIVGTLTDIGLGKIEPDVIERMITTGDRKLAGKTAPARGLTLTGIGYDKNL